MRRLSSVILVGLLSACSGQPAASSPALAGAWRTSPEDLPYTGTIPQQKQVSINLTLNAGGSGVWRPFYSGEGHTHLPAGEEDRQRFRWSATEGAITLEPEGGSGACRGSASPEAIELEVAGCGFLGRLVSLPKVKFTRQ